MPGVKPSAKPGVGGAAGSPVAGNAGGVGAKKAGLPGVKPSAKPSVGGAAPLKPGQPAPQPNVGGGGLGANAMHEGAQVGDAGGGLGAPQDNLNKAVGGEIPEAPAINPAPKKLKMVQRKNSNKLKGDSD